MWNQRPSPLNRRACYEKNTIMLNKTKRFVCCPGITLDIILTVATDFIVHIIIHFEFSMFFSTPQDYMVYLTVCLLAGRSHLIFHALYVQHVWGRGTMNGTLILLLGPSLALHVEHGCPDIILGGTLAQFVYLWLILRTMQYQLMAQSGPTPAVICKFRRHILMIERPQSELSSIYHSFPIVNA